MRNFDLGAEAKRILTAVNSGYFRYIESSGKLHWDEKVKELHAKHIATDVSSLKDWLKLLDAEDAALLVDKFAGLQINGSFTQMTYKIASSDGQVSYFGLRASAISDADGVKVIEGMCWANSKTAEVSDQISAILEGSGVGTFNHRIGTSYARVNSAWFKIMKFELSGHQVLMKDWLSSIDPSDLGDTLIEVKSVLEGKQEQFECLYRVATRGEVVWVLSRGRVTERSATGEPIQISGTIVDLTQQKKIEESVRSEKRKFKNLFQGLNKSALVSIISEAGVIKMANEQFCRAWGVLKEEIVGKKLSDLTEDSSLLSLIESLNKKQNMDSAYQGELLFSVHDGSSFWGDFSLMRLSETTDEIQYIWICFNTTSRKLAEQRLLQSSKMASLGEMAGGVAHEINNPLAIIKGKAEGILRRINEFSVISDENAKDLKKIVQTVDRAAAIVKGLRTFSRGAENDPFQTCDISGIISDTLALCQERFKIDGVEINTTIRVSAPIDCRPTQISQVLLNLLNNAHDAVIKSPSKTITVIAGDIDENTIEISVSDTGPGITPEIREKIMQPFFTTKEPGKGTGLGLSISEGMIKAHSGSFYLDQESKETKFVLRLPKKQVRILKTAG